MASLTVDLGWASLSTISDVVTVGPGETSALTATPRSCDHQDDDPDLKCLCTIPISRPRTISHR